MTPNTIYFSLHPSLDDGQRDKLLALIRERPGVAKVEPFGSKSIQAAAGSLCYIKLESDEDPNRHLADILAIPDVEEAEIASTRTLT